MTNKNFLWKLQEFCWNWQILKLQTINFFETEKHTFEMWKRSFENWQLDLTQYSK